MASSNHWRRVVALAVLLVATVLVAGWIVTFDPRAQLAVAPSPATTSIYDRNGALLYEALDPLRGKATFVSLKELPAHLIHATIATEDASFYSNPGVDPVAILRAVLQNWRSEQITSGASTITQQLARNLWMGPEERGESTLWRKMREATLALGLSVRLGKDEILELYLNSAPYGHQAFGVEAAARVYFGKSARDLDLAESAMLAGLPQAPSAYDPLLNLHAAKARQRAVLSLMVKQGYIGEADAATAAAEDVRLAAAPFPVRAPHFVAYVRQLLADRYRLDPEASRGLRVYTTLDLGLQEMAESAVKRHVAELADKNVTNGALVALDPDTGQILAMVGSADYFDRAIDGEVNVALSPRQPGSSLKPLLYAAAFDQGFTPATVLYDVPTSFLTADGKSYSPENYDRVWHGPVSVRTALANSYNLPAVAMLQRIGVPTLLDVALRAGLSTLAARSSGGLSLALGSGEVRLLDLASAYAALDSRGIGREPVAVLRVEDGQGKVLMDGSSEPSRRVVSPQAAYLVTDILSDDAARAASFGTDSVLKLSRPAAVKTGTTTDWRDNWTVGYTPDLVTAVWVGNSDNTPMRDVSGISGAGPIWHDFMEEALKGRPVARFQEPAGLVQAEVCADSGELPSRWCPNRRTELFIDGTVPTKTCDWYVPVAVDRSTGQAAGPDTPPDRIEQRVFLVLPPELQEWGRARGVPEVPAGREGEGPARAASAPAPGGPTSSTGPRLLISSPSKGAVLQISPDLPLSLQRLEITGAGAGLPPGARVQFLVDGEALASFEAPPYRATWQLRPGRHVFVAQALAGNGPTLAQDEASVTVEGAGP